MASKDYYFSGTTEWARLAKPDTKFDANGIYSMNLYMDKKSFKKYKEAGIQLKIKENDGKDFVTFKRNAKRPSDTGFIENGPPQILVGEDGDDLPPNTLIGNGSEVTIKVRVYDTQKGKGSTLEAVRVDKLVPYVLEDTGPDDMPEEGSPF